MDNNPMPHESQQMISCLQNDVDRLRGEVVTLKRHIEVLQSRNDRLINENKRFQQEAEDLKTDVAAYRFAWAEANRPRGEGE